MRQITAREKSFLGIGALMTVGIFVYFIFWPMLQGKQSGPMSSLEEAQERLESVKTLDGMRPLLIGLEERMRSQSGYEGISFERGIADSMIIKYLAEAAKQADINELEQLDAKPDTSRKTRTEARSDQAILRSVVDQLYLYQVLNQLERETSSNNESSAEDSSSNSNTLVGAENMEQVDQDDFDFVADAKYNPSQIPPAALGFLEQRGVSIEELKENPELREKLKREFEAEFGLGEGGPPDDIGIAERGESTAPSVPEDSELENPALGNEDLGRSLVSTEDMEQIKPKFPMVPKDVSNEVRQSLARFAEASQGKTIAIADINRVIEEAGVEGEKEKGRVRKRLRLYRDRVRERKDEVFLKLTTLGILQNAEIGQKADQFSVKMVFKSRMDQLVKLLYNLQNSAKWLRVEGMRVTISDRKQTVLSVELSMTATTLYD
jgi:hypothetical protein